MNELLAKIEKYILYATVFLFPIVVLPISPNPFVVSKLAILTFGIILTLLLRSFRIILSGKLDFNVGNFDFPVLLIAFAFLLSTILKTPNKMEALLLPGTTTAIVGGALLYYLINQLKENEKQNISKLISLSALVFSLFSLFAFSGILAKIPQLPGYAKQTSFTLEGGSLPAIIFLTTILPLAIGLLLSEKEKSKKVFYAVTLVIISFGLAVSIYNIIPGRPSAPRFPSYSVGWFTAVDSLKESPILGVGPGNYLTAFNRFRPFSYNLTDLWAVKFATARSFYLTLMTEAGLLALAGLILLLVTIYKTARRDLKESKLVNWGFQANANLVSLLLLILILFLAPATTLLVVLTFLLLSLNTKTKHTSLSLTTESASEEQTQKIASRFPALLLTVPVIVATAFLGFRASKALAAEYKFKKGLDRLTVNDASGTYKNMVDAIRLNPFVDRYHLTFARVNLALANAVAQKENITDSDRQSVTVFIQQAINEGKAGVALNRFRAANWEVLGQIYRAIIPLAQGADQFAVQTYRQAVALDPLNPNLRIALGGIYYSRQDYENAIRTFESAVTAKNDHANAHYNLAFALRDAGKIDQAIQEMTLTVSLIKDKNSQDYKVASQALADLQAKKKETAKEGKELTSPQGEKGPELKPPIKLPEGTEPPQAVITPTPTPTPTQAGEKETGTTTPSTSPTPTQIP